MARDDLRELLEESIFRERKCLSLLQESLQASDDMQIFLRNTDQVGFSMSADECKDFLRYQVRCLNEAAESISRAVDVMQLFREKLG